MYGVRSFIFALMMGCACLLAQPSTDSGLVFERTHQDLGEVLGEKRVDFAYSFLNRGTFPISILAVKPGCYCTQASVSKADLAPQETATIHVVFDSRELIGPLRRDIAVYTSDPAMPMVSLTFSANVVWGISPEPSMVIISNAPRRGIGKAKIRLESGNGKPVRIKDATFRHQNPALRVSLKPDGKDSILEVRMDGRKISKEDMSGADELVLDSQETGALTIPVHWELKSYVQVNPSRVAWVGLAGQTLKQTIHLSHISKKPFRVINLESTHPLLHIEGPSKASLPEHQFSIILDKSTPPGSLYGKLTLTLDDPDQPTIMILVTAQLQNQEGHVPDHNL